MSDFSNASTPDEIGKFCKENWRNNEIKILGEYLQSDSQSEKAYTLYYNGFLDGYLKACELESIYQMVATIVYDRIVGIMGEEKFIENHKNKPTLFKEIVKNQMAGKAWTLKYFERESEWRVGFYEKSN